MCQEPEEQDLDADGGTGFKKKVDRAATQVMMKTGTL
jgi:hypothetical protein